MTRRQYRSETADISIKEKCAIIKALIIAHFSLMDMSAVSERYWRRVIFNVDTILLVVILGWVTQFFYPDFLGAMTVDWLEMFLVIPSILLCLAVVISLKLPEN